MTEKNSDHPPVSGAPAGTDSRPKHWRLERDDAGVAWLHLDVAEASANTLSREVLEELDALLAGVEKDKPHGLVILSDKDSGFIAGADVKEFTTLREPGQAEALIHRGQGILGRIEKLPFPTIALIHGFCLGGGLELALACRYRIATDDPRTRLGLPEVRLGIHPGFGGTVRLPRLVGAPAAMDLMLTGRTISARAACKIGLVDYAVPERQLHLAVRSVITKLPKPGQAEGWRAFTNHALVRPLLARVLRKKVAAKAPAQHYPAPYALIDLWAHHGGDPERMLAAEATSVARLIVGDTAQNLVRAFFLQERLKSLGDKALMAPRCVHVIGGGVMGGDIAAWCALHGLEVTVQDRSDEALARVLRRARQLFEKRLKQRHLVTRALDRVIPDKSGLGLAQADVVIEAIIENVEAKQNLFRSIESRVKPEALLATNTSSIPLQVLGEALEQPGRLVGLHFFNPVAKMLLVEVVSAPGTDPQTVAKAAAFTRHIDRLPLPVTSTPGFLVNRMLMPYLLEAVTLEMEGVPGPVIDRVALDFGMPMGPIALADAVGLDICLAVGEILARELGVELPARLRELVDAGHLGRKSGRGFYRYKNDKPQLPRRDKSYRSPADLQDRLILRMLNEGVACLREGVVADAGLLDAGMIFGTGFAPFRGGPVHYLEQAGKDRLLKRLQELEKRHGERFAPDAGWSGT